jgi:uncharacterized membrane protein
MVDKKQIDIWLKEGTINKKQAQKMLSDSSVYKTEEKSNKLIITISTIGSILIGIGAILFIASNWKAIPNFAKVLTLVGSTFGAYYTGYIMKYKAKTLPKVGTSLVFLGALLFGATVILIAQMYNLNANNHVLTLIWLIGILPLVYVLKSKPIAGLASLLFLMWVGVYFSADGAWLFFGSLGPLIFILYLISAVMLFAVGGVHYKKKGFENIGRIYRIAGLKVLMISLFILTFSWFSKASPHIFKIYEGIPAKFKVAIIVFSMIAILATIINWLFNNSERLSLIEGPISVILIVLALIFYFYPSETSIYVLIFNLILTGMISLLIYAGYEREDMKIVNLGLFWLVVFVIVKYFDLFWDLLPRSLFFLIGGMILVSGGIALEQKRRQLKARFLPKDE